MTPTLEAVAAGLLHPELVTSGIYGWDGHKPIFVLEN
ncbi:hypothetical protein QFZ56_006792 [Streptomyces achromogenes]|uniref:Uncharacterized protein n=1 Tax=Streptomyces achromogenes TaxID=67255 RepID=A0ABU0QAY4_STRAH|nr:hypothetical protein [Streptomyces achromogenes]